MNNFWWAGFIVIFFFLGMYIGFDGGVDYGWDLGYDECLINEVFDIVENNGCINLSNGTYELNETCDDAYEVSDVK